MNLGIGQGVLGVGQIGMLGVSLRGQGLGYWSELFLRLRRFQSPVAIFLVLCLLLPRSDINRLNFAWRGYESIEGCGFVVFPPASLAWELEIRLHRQWLRRCKRRAAGAGEATGRMGLIGGGCAVAWASDELGPQRDLCHLSPLQYRPPTLALTELPCVLGVCPNAWVSEAKQPATLELR